MGNQHTDDDYTEEQFILAELAGFQPLPIDNEPLGAWDELFQWMMLNNLSPWPRAFSKEWRAWRQQNGKDQLADKLSAQGTMGPHTG